MVDVVDHRVHDAGEDRVAAGARGGEHAPAVARRDDRGHGEERHLARRDRVRAARPRVVVHHRVVQQDARAGHRDQRPEVVADRRDERDEVAVGVGGDDLRRPARAAGRRRRRLARARRPRTATGRPSPSGRGDAASSAMPAARSRANAGLARPASGAGDVVGVAGVGDVVDERVAHRLGEQVEVLGAARAEGAGGKQSRMFERLGADLVVGGDVARRRGSGSAARRAASARRSRGPRVVRMPPPAAISAAIASATGAAVEAVGTVARRRGAASRPARAGRGAPRARPRCARAGRRALGQQDRGERGPDADLVEARRDEQQQVPGDLQALVGERDRRLEQRRPGQPARARVDRVQACDGTRHGGSEVAERRWRRARPRASRSPRARGRPS